MGPAVKKHHRQGGNWKGQGASGGREAGTVGVRNNMKDDSGKWHVNDCVLVFNDLRPTSLRLWVK